MKTYNSYEAAKIANPESDIYKLISMDGFVFGDGLGDLIRISSLQTDAKKCNPADHCTRYDDFLTLGHEFVDGDAFLNSRGEVVIITNAQSNNRIVDGDDKRFILRAVALEEKPSEKVEWNGEGLPPVGVECWFNFKVTHPQRCKVNYIGKTVCVYESADGNEYSTLISEVEFSKIETQQQREDRERLEAAYDLYCEWRGEMHESFDAFKRCNHDNWLSIVDKTKYRISK